MDEMQKSGARHKIKVEKMDNVYSPLAVGYATGLERATEHKTRIRDAARKLAAEAGLSPTDARRSAARDGGRAAVHRGGGDSTPVVQNDGDARGYSVPVKTPKYSGKADWEAFHAQFELLSRAAGWSEENKALQLALCLTDDALACLLLLSSEERSDYGALVGALQRRFGHCEQPGLLRSELCSRRRQPGEPLRVLANDIETLSRRAYAHMTPAVQSELAQDQFIQAITPRELSVQTQLAHPCTLQEALELAIEREIVGGGATESRLGPSSPAVRTAVDSSPAQEKPAWVAELTEMIRAVSLQPTHSAAHPRQRPLVCWGCGQPGHALRQCPKFANNQGNGSGSV